VPITIRIPTLHKTGKWLENMETKHESEDITGRLRELKWRLRSLWPHCVILNIISYAFYELNGGKLTFFLISFVKCIRNDVHDDAMCETRNDLKCRLNLSGVHTIEPKLIMLCAHSYKLRSPSDNARLNMTVSCRCATFLRHRVAEHF